MREVTTYLESGDLHDLNRAYVEQWLHQFQDELRTYAEADGLTLRDFACTILAAIVGTDSAVFLQVGDGAIVVSQRAEPNEYAWVFWPQRGEYANTTYFSTDDTAREHLEYALVEGGIDEVALFTDGIQPLALHYETQTAFEPFFRPVFATLRSVPEGVSAELSTALADFLDSPRVNAKSDDDKTLAIATRRPARQPLVMGAMTTSDTTDDHTV